MKFKSPHIERNIEICAAYKAGQSPAEVARGFGLSHTRVLQILHLWGARAISGREDHSSFGRDMRKFEASKTS